ncbi:MAG: hypothetical protein Q7R49_01200 [Candidatus Daviesbacteria bacterium]|nr:hypothetical protein [Candidatus Daviesbacteria bacterium]
MINPDYNPELQLYTLGLDGKAVKDQLVAHLAERESNKEPEDPLPEKLLEQFRHKERLDESWSGEFLWERGVDNMFIVFKRIQPDQKYSIFLKIVPNEESVSNDLPKQFPIQNQLRLSLYDEGF